MKFVAVILSVLLLQYVTAQEKAFVVNGTIPATAKKLKALLSWNNGATAEEVNVVNGKFTIKGTIDEPVAATLMLQETNLLPIKSLIAWSTSATIFLCFSMAESSPLSQKLF